MITPEDKQQHNATVALKIHKLVCYFQIEEIHLVSFLFSFVRFFFFLFFYKVIL